MRSTVIDLPSAIEHARTLAAQAGHEKLVDYRAGNLMDDDFGTGWDVVLLSNILHHFAMSDVRALLRKVAAAIGSAGTVAIWDLERPAPGAPPDAGDGIALFFRLTSTAGAYSGQEYASWLVEAGFQHVKVIRPKLRPGTVLVRGRRP
jgi:2-polyprenyl-3-methyl-5-hydroxy-6-metoxy-1,4-benzoquinol methylase